MIFALQPAANSPGKNDVPKGGRLVSLAQLKLAGVDGLTIRFRRDWPLSFVAENVAKAKKAGKPYTLLLCSGDSQKPWEPANVAAYESAAAMLGKTYAADPLCWGVHVTGCTPPTVSEEQHWKITPQSEVANKRLITAWASAFPRQAILFAIGGDDPPAMRRLIDFGIATAPGRFLVKHNALKSRTSIDAAHNQLVIYAGKRGAKIGFEMTGSTLESRTGTLSGSFAKGEAVAKLAGQPISYLAVYPPDLNKLGGLR